MGTLTDQLDNLAKIRALKAQSKKIAMLQMTYDLLKWIVKPIIAVKLLPEKIFQSREVVIIPFSITDLNPIYGGITAGALVASYFLKTTITHLVAQSSFSALVNIKMFANSF